MKPAQQPRKARRSYQRTGVFGVKRALKEQGIAALDGRTVAARSVREWRRSVEADLGGSAALSRQEHTLLDMAGAAVFLLGMIDAWIGAHPAQIMNRRKRSLAPVVRERTAVAEHLARLLGQIGLKRVARPVPSIAEVMAGGSR